MKILYAASEAAPFAKSGGLADVAGALPKALVRDGIDARVVMPLYGDLKFKDTLTYVTNFSVPVGWRSQYCGLPGFLFRIRGRGLYHASSTFLPVTGSGISSNARMMAMRIYTPLCT